MSIIIEDMSHIYMAGTPMATAALCHIQLQIGKGEFIGLIGHTGSGKSTLIQHINGLLTPTSGTVTVDGVDTREKKALLDIRRKVGLVFQYPEYQLFEETVEKDVAFGPKNLGLSDGECQKCVAYALDQVGLDYGDFKDKSPFALSGGEKRRVAIAGVLAMRPSTIILDEPTSGLDPRGSKQILAMIKRLQSQEITVVMVSHNMDEVVRIASRIVVISEGEILFNDVPSVVFQHTQELLDIGLDVPTACHIAHELRCQGVEVPEHILEIDQLAAYVREMLQVRS